MAAYGAAKNWAVGDTVVVASLFVQPRDINRVGKIVEIIENDYQFSFILQFPDEKQPRIFGYNELDTLEHHFGVEEADKHKI